MHRTPSSISCRAILFGVSVTVLCPSCGTNPSPGSPGRLPDSEVARKAVETSLRKWHDSPDLPPTSNPSSSVVFVDQQRRPGRRLLAFAVLGESEAEGCRRFLVKLSLAEPD